MSRCNLGITSLAVCIFAGFLLSAADAVASDALVYRSGGISGGEVRIASIAHLLFPGRKDWVYTELKREIPLGIFAPPTFSGLKTGFSSGQGATDLAIKPVLSSLSVPRIPYPESATAAFLRAQLSDPVKFGLLKARSQTPASEAAKLQDAARAAYKPSLPDVNPQKQGVTEFMQALQQKKPATTSTTSTTTSTKTTTDPKPSLKPAEFGVKKDTGTGQTAKVQPSAGTTKQPSSTTTTSTSKTGVAPAPSSSQSAKVQPSPATVKQTTSSTSSTTTKSSITKAQTGTETATQKTTTQPVQTIPVVQPVRPPVATPGRK